LYSPPLGGTLTATLLRRLPKALTWSGRPLSAVQMP